MDRKTSSNAYSLTGSTEAEAPIITLFPCDYDSSIDDDSGNLSLNSNDSSELVNDSDDEAEHIFHFRILSKELNKKNETSSEVSEIKITTA